jgi:hypothetical protein
MNKAIVTQAHYNNDHTTAVASNAWEVVSITSNATPPAKITYKSAVALAENETSATLCQLFGLSNEDALLPPKDIILKATGYNVTLPEPTPDGAIAFTKDSLKKLTVERLKQLHRVTPGVGKKKHKKKDDFINDILKHHPEAILQRSIASNEDNTQHSLTGLQELLLKERQRDSPLVSFYTDHYNLVDRMNKAYYQVVAYWKHRNYLKHFFLSLTWDFIIASHAISEEHKCAREYARTGRRISSVDDVTPTNLVLFLKNVCKQICN